MELAERTVASLLGIFLAPRAGRHPRRGQAQGVGEPVVGQHLGQAVQLMARDDRQRPEERLRVGMHAELEAQRGHGGSDLVSLAGLLAGPEAGSWL